MSRLNAVPFHVAARAAFDHRDRSRRLADEHSRFQSRRQGRPGDGGTRGIGAAYAKLLAERGASVAVTNSRSCERADALVGEIEGAGGSAFAIAAHAGDADAGKAGVAEAVHRFGGQLDILVNNAGVAEHAPCGSLSDAAFERQLDINVRRVWHTSTAAATAMRDRGRVINIGSFFSERVPAPGTSAYGMTKHAMAGLTKGWARDLAPGGSRSTRSSQGRSRPRPILMKAGGRP